MYDSPDGRLPKAPGWWMSPVEEIAFTPSMENARSVPAAVVTRTRWPALSSRVTCSVRSAMA